MPRSRIDNSGSVQIEYEDGEFTNIVIQWQEELTDGSSSMIERMSETIPIDDLSVGDRAKLDVAVTLAQSLRTPLNS